MVWEVVVVGGINTDLVITLPHLPAPGETVVGGGLQTFGGGKGASRGRRCARWRQRLFGWRDQPDSK